MSVNLSIKDVPDELAQRLRERAARHHRSLQGELMAIVEAAVLGLTSSVKASEPGATYSVTLHHAATGSGSAHAPDGDLLAALDAIVAGSRWGEAPLLTREQLHDRALAREADLQTRDAELEIARARTPARSRHRRGA